MLPFYVAAASCLVLLTRTIWTSAQIKTSRAVNEQVPNIGDLAAGFFTQRGGAIIVSFKVMRLGGVLALLGLSTFANTHDAWTAFDLALVASLVRRAPFFKSVHAKRIYY